MILICIYITMRFAQKSWQKFATLNTQYLANKNKNAVRFQSQNLSWDYEVAEYHTKAFAKGLRCLNFSDNHNFLLRLPPSQQAEAYVAKVATANINANLIISEARTLDDFDRELTQHNINGVIFEPTLPLGDDLTIDGLYRLMPELKNLEQGSQIQPQKYNNLKMLIQTNFYTYPGVFKYRSIFNYSRDEYTPFKGTDHSPINLPNSNNPVIITQPAHQFAFKAGILNSLVNGRYVVCAEASDVSKIVHYYDGNVDLIATEECAVPDTVDVLVEKGSCVLSGHSRRTQL